MKIKMMHPTAKMPTKGTKGAAGYDLYSTQEIILRRGIPTMVPTGLAFEVPEGYCMVVYSRSSSAKKGIVITPLIVDSDYRGEVFVLANYLGNDDEYRIHAGDRIAQIKLEKLTPIEFEWATELSKTERGASGYGSTGR